MIFIQPSSFMNAILSFNTIFFEINPATPAINVEQLAIGTPTIDPTPVEDREVPANNSPTPVRISNFVT